MIIHLLLQITINCSYFRSISDDVAQAYLWPKFPFFPGLNFPPSTPSWMTDRRPSLAPIIPQLPEIRLPPIRLPWPHPDDDDDDESDEDENGDNDDIEKCPDDGVKLISHPDNCEKYILCIDGNKIAEMECPNGMHFSRDLRTCTDPDDAECE